MSKSKTGLETPSWDEFNSTWDKRMLFWKVFGGVMLLILVASVVYYA